MSPPEAAVFRKYTPPPEFLIIAGVIGVTTNYLEHPEAVAKRIGAVLEVVGRNLCTIPPAAYHYRPTNRPGRRSAVARKPSW